MLRHIGIHIKTEWLQTKQNACSIIWGGKGKDRVMLIKSLFNLRVLRGAIKDIKGIGICDNLLHRSQ